MAFYHGMKQCFLPPNLGNTKISNTKRSQLTVSFALLLSVLACQSALAQVSTGVPSNLLSVPGDENWDDRFGMPGVDGFVSALAVSGNVVYIGGSFVTAGGVRANYLAKWDGSNWSALGSGPDSTVRAIAISGSWTPVFADPKEGVIGSMAVHSSGMIVAGTGRSGIFRVTNNGGSWTRLTSMSLKGIPVIPVAISANGHIFAGAHYTDGKAYIDGIYRSTDNGASWTEVNSGLTNHQVFALISNSYGRIFAGTDDGVYRSTESTTSVKEETLELPASITLKQNYPNPFNPNTTISFSLPHSGYGTLKVYNTQGAEVVTLVAENLFAGRHQAVWNASGIAGGVYFYRLHAGGDLVQTKKLVVVK